MDSNLVADLIIALGRALRRLLRPARSAAKLMVGAAGDLTRTRSELTAENALLRQQLIVLHRSVKRPVAPGLTIRQGQARVDASVACRERLGGLLRYYHRKAA